MSIKIIDTHCHLDMEEFDNDREDVIKRSKDGGIKAVIMPSTTEEDYDKEKSLCDEYNGFLFYFVGIHPHDAKTCTHSTYDTAINHLDNKSCVGIGEIGLDYYYEHSPKNIQKDVFNNFLDIAIEKDLPVSIHSRDATNDMVDILKTKKSLKGVIHCFSGEDELLKVGLELGLFFGIGGVVTFKKSLLRKNIKNVPIEYMVLETDAPYLAPVPKRGKRNEPLYIDYVLNNIAELTNNDKEKIASVAYNNSKALFGI